MDDLAQLYFIAGQLGRSLHRMSVWRRVCPTAGDERANRAHERLRAEQAYAGLLLDALCAALEDAAGRRKGAAAATFRDLAMHVAKVEKVRSASE